MNLICKLRGHMPPPMQYFIDTKEMNRILLMHKRPPMPCEFYCLRCGKKVDFSYMLMGVK